MLPPCNRHVLEGARGSAAGGVLPLGRSGAVAAAKGAHAAPRQVKPPRRRRAATAYLHGRLARIARPSSSSPQPPRTRRRSHGWAESGVDRSGGSSKPGLQSVSAGSVARLEISTAISGPMSTAISGPISLGEVARNASLSVTYLSSPLTGRARVRCLAGCDCAPLEIDSTRGETPCHRHVPAMYPPCNRHVTAM